MVAYHEVVEANYYMCMYVNSMEKGRSMTVGERREHVNDRQSHTHLVLAHGGGAPEMT